MRPEGILFDLDDTILAYSIVSESTWRDVCETYAPKVRGLSSHVLYSEIKQVSQWYWSDDVRHKIGRLDLHAARRDILGQVFRRLNLEDLLLAHRVADAFSDQREQACFLFPGAEDTLARLAQSGVALALVTNGAEDKQRAKIERFHLDQYFQTIWIEGARGVGKPEQQVYIDVLESLNLEPEGAWFVGDNLKWDVAAPQALGIYGIWNDFKHRGLPPETAIVPDRIIHNISELVSF